MKTVLLSLFIFIMIPIVAVAQFQIEVPASGGIIASLDSMTLTYENVTIFAPNRTREQGILRIGDTVITADNRSGVVDSIFPQTNKVVVRHKTYGNRSWSPDKIAVTNGCTKWICVGDKVVTLDRRSGEVVGYFNNGNVVVLNGTYGYRTFSPEKVALTVGCTSSFCTGDSVITSDNRYGTIVGFFPKGLVVVYHQVYGDRLFRPENIVVKVATCTSSYVQRPHSCTN